MVSNFCLKIKVRLDLNFTRRPHPSVSIPFSSVEEILPTETEEDSGVETTMGKFLRRMGVGFVGGGGQ